MPDLFEALAEHTGQFNGQGTNHEDEDFEGRLSLAPLPGDRGVELRFTAAGDDGVVFHEERAWIARDIEGKTRLWAVSDDTPGVVDHTLQYETEPEGAIAAYVFGHGDMDQGEAFRQELTLTLYEDGALGYAFAWGMPGEEVRPRSRVRLEPITPPEVPG